MQDEILRTARILIVDDQPANLLLLDRVLGPAGYGLKGITDPREALQVFDEFQPDLVLLDMHMPHLDGLSLMKEMQARIPEGVYLPILVITADVFPEAKQKALSGGARDFLNKPFDATEVRLRIRNLLETRFLHVQLQDQNRYLEQRIRERTQELEQAQVQILERLARAAEYRDDDTGQHTQRVGRISADLAEALGLPPDLVKLIRRAAPLHDVGKIGIPDRILLKPAKLSDVEFDFMKTHTTIGAGILAGGSFPLLQLAEEIALYHHERWDGKGYFRVHEDTIPLVARIVCLADTFDALTHERPYKRAWPLDEALAEIARNRGLQFDPRVVDTFLRGARSQDLANLGAAVAESIEAAGTVEPEVGVVRPEAM